MDWKFKTLVKVYENENAKMIKEKFLELNKKCFRNINAPLGAKFKITTYKAWLQSLHQVWYRSSEGVKRYWADNTVGWEEWFDLDLWTCDLKINRDHLLIEGNPCTKYGIDQVKGSKDIDRTRLGLQTDIRTDRLTGSCNTICPLFQGGHKKTVTIDWFI